jgi:hypothetical protein
LRRELCSAERFSEVAIRFGSRKVNTPRFRSSASLSRVTRCDQRFGDALRFAGAFRRVVVLPAVFRGDLRAVLLDAFLRELVAIVSFHLRYEAKTAINSIGSAVDLGKQYRNRSIPRALTSTIPVADVLRKPGTQGSRTFLLWLGSNGLAANECESGNRA